MISMPNCLKYKDNYVALNNQDKGRGKEQMISCILAMCCRV